MKNTVVWISLIIFFMYPISLQAQTTTPTHTTLVLTSDSSWKVSREVAVGWEKPGFDDGNWEHSVVLPHTPCGGWSKTVQADLIWAKNPKSRETVYLRKTISLKTAPLSVLLKTYFDDDGDVYLNGMRVMHDIDGTDGTSQGYYASFFRKGENTIAIAVKDVTGLCQSTAFFIELKIPNHESYELEIPLVKQSAPAWSEKIYAGGSKDNMFCGTTIGHCGCVVSSLAMLLNFHKVTKSPDGLKTSPDVLNEYLSRNQRCNEYGCVSDGYVYGDVVWGALHKYTKSGHDMYQSPKVMLVGGGVYDKDQVKDDIKNNKPVVLRAPNKSHWFIASGIDGDSLSIRDPLYEWGVLDNPDYKNTASQMRRFSKVNSDFSAIEIFIKEPGHIVLTSPDGKKYGHLQEGLYFDENGVRHLLVQTPKKGTYGIEIMVPSSEKTEYVVVNTNRSAENVMYVEHVQIGESAPGFTYDPDFQPPTPTLTYTVPTASPIIRGYASKNEMCRGGENRTPTARTPCAHSTIILLPVSRLPFLAPACYDVFRFDDGYNLRQSSLFFTSDYFIIN